jgi:hypothetical protein
MNSKHIVAALFGTLTLATVVGCAGNVPEEERESDVVPVAVDTDTTTAKRAEYPNGHDGRCTGGELFIGCTQQQNGLYTYFCSCPQGTW